MSIKPKRGKCAVCNKEKKQTVVCCSACSAFSHTYCLDCLKAGLEPYSALVSMMTYYEDINESFKKDILDPSLKFHNKTPDDFNIDVKKLKDDFARAVLNSTI